MVVTKLLRKSISGDLVQFINKTGNCIYRVLQLETSSFLIVGWLVSVYSSVGLSLTLRQKEVVIQTLSECPRFHVRNRGVSQVGEDLRVFNYALQLVPVMLGCRRDRYAKKEAGKEQGLGGKVGEDLREPNNGMPEGGVVHSLLGVRAGKELALRFPREIREQ